VPGPYVVPNFRIELNSVYTNMVSTTPVRGAGRPQGVFVMERMMDRLAEASGLDRAEVRRRNFVKPEQMPYKVGIIFRDGRPVTYDSGDIRRRKLAPSRGPIMRALPRARRRPAPRAGISASVSAMR
jgi:CO/xanthine dehydrogenase Mo-binding subunit